MMLHTPVMLKETIDGLGVRFGGKYIDGTFGRGGHSQEIIRRGGVVLGIDRDDEAVKSADEIKVIKGTHGNLKAIAEDYGWNEVDGVLLDLGVSSPQLDDAGRGFSFLKEGPLDMRMDRSSGISAMEIVNNESAEKLAKVFREFGEEPQARRIALGIVEVRAKHPFNTTTELAEFIEKLIGRRGARHPATRVFQALRMEVNDEVGELERALEGGLEILANGGRFAVITFESITDRMVKTFFAGHVGKMESLQQGGSRWVGKLPRARAITRRAITASEEEILSNVRSRSAKLRIIEKE